MKFTVRDCDPNTGVPEEDGYDDEYVVSSWFFFFFPAANSSHWADSFLPDLKPVGENGGGSAWNASKIPELVSD